MLKAWGPQTWCACCGKLSDEGTEMICITSRMNGDVSDDGVNNYRPPLIEKKYVRVDHLWEFIQNTLQGDATPMVLNKGPDTHPLPQMPGRHNKVSWNG